MRRRQMESATSEIPLPRLERDNRPFWTGGAQGELLILRCRECATYAHPPVPRCRDCGSADLVPTAVSGQGHVFTFTINRQPFLPSMPAPYVLAIVELVEQEGLQFTTRIIGCAPDAVSIGMPVQVQFEEHGEVHLPVFAPESVGG